MSKPIIQALFGVGARAKVVHWLYNQPSDSEPIAARRLAREAGVPYGSIAKTLQELTNDELVERLETAHGPHYRAPHDDPRLLGLFLLIRQDSDIAHQLQQEVAALNGLVYACVFGSFAAGTTRKGSDVDVLLLHDGTLDRFAAMGALGKVSDRIGREVNPQFYSVPDFNEHLQNDDPVVRSIVANPRIELKGAAPWQS